jgi:hypothetical protein
MASTAASKSWSASASDFITWPRDAGAFEFAGEADREVQCEEDDTGGGHPLADLAAGL